MSTRSKKLGGLITVLLFLLGGTTAFLIQQQQYVPLYPNSLSPGDVQEISVLLQDLRVDYHLSQTQDSLLVPPAKKRLAQSALAAEGLPRFETTKQEAEDSSFSTEDQRRRVAKANLQKELVSTLRRVKSIKDARVTIAQPSRSLFDKEQVTASVFLELKPGAKISKEEVSGIVGLIANSVPGLARQNVSLLDKNGQELMPSSSEELFQLDHEQLVKQRLERNLNVVLGNVFSNRAVAVVNVELDYSQETVKRYTPGSPEDKGVVDTSFQVLREILSRSDEEDSKNYEETKKSVNRAIQEYYYEKLQKMARIKRLTATVAVDGLASNHKEEVEKIVAGAIGYNFERGDQITISTIPWDREMMREVAAIRASGSQEPAASEDQGLALAIGLSLGMGATLLGLSLLNRWAKPVLGVETGAGAAPAGLSPIVDQGRQTASKGLGETVSQTERLEALVSSQQDEVVRQLKSTWLS